MRVTACWCYVLAPHRVASPGLVPIPPRMTAHRPFGWRGGSVANIAAAAPSSILAIGAGARCQTQITNITPGGTKRVTRLARRIHQFRRGI
jgi:hypothetical protein